MKIPENIELKPDIELEKLKSKEEAEQAAQTLRESIRYHNYKYYIEQDPVISDPEFDLLMETLQKLEDQWPDIKTEDSPTQRVGGEPVEELETVEHPYPMLSLQATREEEKIRNFDQRCRKELNQETITYVAEPKYDGAAVELIYQEGKLIQAATRGDGERGDNVTENVKTIEELPLKLFPSTEAETPFRLVLHGEVYMRIKEFKEYNKQRRKEEKDTFANPRNAAAGSLRQLNPKKTAHRPLHIFIYQIANAEELGFDTHLAALEILPNWGLPTNPERTKKCIGTEELFIYYQEMKKQREKLAYEVDGVVFKINNLQDREILGTRTNNPRWAIAYKFEPQRITTKLKDVKFQVGRTGKITPVAKLEPVNIGGVEVRRASLHNQKEIEKKDIRVGDTVLVERAGDVIPYVVKPIEETRTGDEKRIELPKTCPVCDTEIIVSDDKKQAKCPNLSCPAQLKGRLTHYASRQAMGIEGLGEKIAQQLHKAGVINRISDLYKINKADLIELERFAEKSADNLITEIEQSKQASLPNFLYALGIPLVGQHMAEVLAQNFSTLEDIKNAGQEDLENIHEIGPEVARSVIHFFSREENKKVIDELEKAGINLENLYSEQKEKKLNGLRIVFTGALENWTRDEAKKIVERLGGRAVSSVSSETDYLVRGENPGSKLQQAEEENVKILTEEEFQDFVS